MERILRIARQAGLIGMDNGALRALAASGSERISGDDAWIYRRSVRMQDGILYFISARAGKKSLCLVGERPFSSPFQGETTRTGGFSIQEAGFSPHNAGRLHEIFPFTAPVSLRGRMTTLGCGDRLGLATPGHIRAVRGYAAAPVLAQQSVRELTLTQRTFPGIVADATFLVFQEGYELGYGADGDHLKTIADIDAALAAGMPMITLDLSDVMAAEPSRWSAAKVDEEFGKLGPDARGSVLERYADKTFMAGNREIPFSAVEAKRCALMYLRARDFSREADSHIRARRGKSYDLEISIDETTAPTLPEHHVFIARELQLRGVMASSLAPRFVGEFQKGVDYIGDVGEFEKQFEVHCAIARQSGGYKISVHSGSDKFSVYPPIGRHTGMRLHLKTAGTSWLQALLVISRANPSFFRRLVAKARESFADATKLYYVTTDLAKVPDASGLKDGELPGLLEQRDPRQLLHITYGGLLKDPDIRAGIYETLTENEEQHYAAVQQH
ncbi:MAG TPA: tagaturonate epimerase family protein, partial [Spirochaetia bacterium]|nr:tagaturonate epimerase family protein [Spirochaetia bacterium]